MKNARLEMIDNCSFKVHYKHYYTDTGFKPQTLVYDIRKLP